MKITRIRWSDIPKFQTIRVVIINFSKCKTYVRDQYILLEEAMFYYGPDSKRTDMFELSLPKEKFITAIVRRPVTEQLIIKHNPCIVEIVKENRGKIVINSIKEYYKIPK